VLNELIMNAIEHGIAQRSHGVITLSLQDFGDALELRVEDDGAGLPADFGVAKRDSLGLQIVQTLVTSDLKGKLRFENITGAEGSDVGGVRASLTIPKLPLGK
jgi:two-component system, sensor histidine kinase PdtaS